MRRWIPLALVVLALSGCWQKRVKHLSDAEFDHYYALRPFMEEDLQKQFLKLKTEEERNTFLKATKVGQSTESLWEMFYSLSEAEREAIVGGEVEVGWTEKMVLMSWGAPFEKSRLPGRQAQRSELMIWRFEVQEDGTIMVWIPGSKTAYTAVRRFQRRVIFDDGRVTSIEDVQGW